MHLCRGNFKSAWAAEGGYEPVAEVLFNELAVDGYFLEYDDARSGDFAPLRFVPKGKIVVLGLVSTKVGQLESKDDLKRAHRRGRAATCRSSSCACRRNADSRAPCTATISPSNRRPRSCGSVVETARDVWGGVWRPLADLASEFCSAAASSFRRTLRPAGRDR